MALPCLERPIGFAKGNLCGGDKQLTADLGPHHRSRHGVVMPIAHGSERRNATLRSCDGGIEPPQPFFNSVRIHDVYLRRFFNSAKTTSLANTQKPPMRGLAGCREADVG